MIEPTEPEKDWYASAFNALYPIIYAHRTVEAAAPEAEFAAEALGLSATDKVLDLCCGNGRHMVHLLRRTARVWGLDYSADLLGMARRALGGRGHLVRGDMRALPFAGCFDAVANFFTSFGYFPTTEENMLVARGIAGVLCPEGRFFMDYLNPEQVAVSLVPLSERTEGQYHIMERRWIDTQRRRVNKQMRVSHGDKVVMESHESVRMYPLEELKMLLDRAGLVVERVHGDYEGGQWGDTSPRMILTGRRKEGAAHG